MKTQNRLRRLLTFDWSQFDAVEVHLIATCLIAVFSRMYEDRILGMVTEFNGRCPPLFPGVWLVGLGIQALMIALVLKEFKRFARAYFCFAYGYWFCVIVSLTACLLSYSSVLVR